MLISKKLFHLLECKRPTWQYMSYYQWHKERIIITLKWVKFYNKTCTWYWIDGRSNIWVFYTHDHLWTQYNVFDNLGELSLLRFHSKDSWHLMESLRWEELMSTFWVRHGSSSRHSDAWGDCSSFIGVLIQKQPTWEESTRFGLFCR